MMEFMLDAFDLGHGLSNIATFDDFSKNRRKSLSLSDEAWLLGDSAMGLQGSLGFFQSSCLDSSLEVALPNPARLILEGLTDDRDETAMNRLLDTCVDADAKPFEGIEAADLSSLLMQFEEAEEGLDGINIVDGELEIGNLDSSDESSCTSESLDDLLDQVVLPDDLDFDQSQDQDLVTSAGLNFDFVVPIPALANTVEHFPSTIVDVLDAVTDPASILDLNISIDEGSCSEIDVGLDLNPAEILRKHLLSVDPPLRKCASEPKSLLRLVTEPKPLKSVLKKDKQQNAASCSPNSTPPRTPPPEMIEKIKQSTKRKSAIMLPCSAPAKRGRGTAVEATARPKSWCKPLDAANENDLKLDHDYCARATTFSVEDDQLSTCSSDSRLVMDSAPNSRSNSRPASPLPVSRGYQASELAQRPMFSVSATGLIATSSSPRSLEKKLLKKAESAPNYQPTGLCISHQTRPGLKIKENLKSPSRICSSGSQSVLKSLLVTSVESSAQTQQQTQLLPPMQTASSSKTDVNKPADGSQIATASCSSTSTGIGIQVTRAISPSSCSMDSCDSSSLCTGSSICSGDILHVEDMEIDNEFPDTDSIEIIKRKKKISLDQYRKKNRHVDPKCDAEGSVSKLPDRYTVLSTHETMSQDVLGKAVAKEMKGQRGRQHDRDPSPVREETKSKIPAYHSCFTNSTKYDNGASHGARHSDRHGAHGASHGSRQYRKEVRKRKTSKTTDDRSPSPIAGARSRSISVSRSSSGSRSSSRSRSPAEQRDREARRKRRDDRIMKSIERTERSNERRRRPPSYRGTVRPVRRVDRSRSRSRSSSFERRQRREEERKEELMKQRIDERRIVYVGAIPPNYERSHLRRRFSKFGHIEDIGVHHREKGDNYGFVTFLYACDAFAAISKGNSDPNEPKVDLCFGGRREFCKTSYADLDGNQEIEEEFCLSMPKPQVTDFDQLLRQFQKAKKTVVAKPAMKR